MTTQPAALSDARIIQLMPDYDRYLTMGQLMGFARAIETERQAVPITMTDNDVERLSLEAGWTGNRKYMTPEDFRIWCNRMRTFVKLASSPQS